MPALLRASYLNVHCTKELSRIGKVQYRSLLRLQLLPQIHTKCRTITDTRYCYTHHTNTCVFATNTHYTPVCVCACVRAFPRAARVNVCVQRSFACLGSHELRTFYWTTLTEAAESQTQLAEASIGRFLV